jgi:predicted transcriptional regulator
MPRSFRLDPALEERLSEVARREGTTVSAVVREAITRHCDAVLGADPWAPFADLVGVIHSGGGRARRTGEAFKELLAERERARRERFTRDPH